MRLPIETSRLTSLVVATAEPLRQYKQGKPHEAWAPQTDVYGEVLGKVPLVAPGRGGGGDQPRGGTGESEGGRGEVVGVGSLAVHGP